MVNKGITYISYIILLVLSSLLVSFAVYRNNNKTIQGLDVYISDYDTVKFINKKIIDKLVGIKYDSIFYRSQNTVDVSLIEKEVEMLSSVNKAEVYIDVSGVLSIHLNQRKPIARIITSKYNCYIDRKGNKMALSRVYTANVPLIDGKVNDENLQEIYKILIYINKNEVLKNQIVSIRVDKKNRYKLRTRVGNQVIILGEIENMEEKFEKLLIFYRETIPDFGWDRYKIINLEFANQIVCQK